MIKNIIISVLFLMVLSQCGGYDCTDDGCPEFCKEEYNEC